MTRSRLALPVPDRRSSLRPGAAARRRPRAGTIATRSTNGMLLGMIPLLALTLSTLAVRDARAACLPASPVDNDLVICDGVDSDGFDGSGATGLTITTDGAAVLTDGSPVLDSAIRISSDNTVTIGADATITVEDPGGAGIRGEDRNTITNDGTITVEATAIGGVAIDVGDGVDVAPPATPPTIVNSGTITLRGAGSIGVNTNDNHEVTNTSTGVINVLGDDGVAIRGNDDNFVTNDGQITIDGSNGRGIQIRDNTGLPLPNGAISRGTITVNGVDGYAIESGDNAGISIEGSINLNGRGGRGLSAGSKSNPFAQANITNQATINVEGDESVGMQVGNGWTTGGALSPNANATVNAGTLNVRGDRSVGIVAGDDTAGTTANNSFVTNSTTGSIQVIGVDSIGVSLGGNNLLALPVPGFGRPFDPTPPRYSFENLGLIQGSAESGPLVEFRSSAIGQNLVVNRASGSIIADLTNLGDSNRGIAVRGSEGDDRVDNFGAIQGDLFLNGGADLYVHGDAATLTGTVRGGEGDDVAILAPSSNALASFDVLLLEGFEVLSIDGDDNTDPGWQLLNTQNFFGLVNVTADGSLFAPAPITLGGDFVNAGRTTGDLSFGDAGVRVENSGTIDGELVFGAGADRLTNIGTLMQDAALGDGDDLYEQGRQAVVGGIIDGGSGEDRALLGSSGSVMRTFDVSRLQNFERLQLGGPEAGDDSLQLGWELTNAATFMQPIEVLSGGVLNATANPVTLGGDLVLGPQSGIRLRTDGGATPLTIGGATTFAGTLVVEDSPAFDATGSYRLIDVNGSLTPSSFANELLLGAGGFTLASTRYDATGVSLVVFVSPDFAGVAAGANRTAIARHLDRLQADPSTASTITDQLDLFSTGTGDLNDLYDALSPEPYDAQTTLVSEGSRLIASLLMNRPRECRPGQLDPWQASTRRLPCHARTWSPWIAAIGSIRHRDAFAGHPKYESQMGGLVFGIDTRPIRNLELTLAVASQRGQVDVRRSGESDLVLADVSGHAAWDLGPLRLQSVVTWGYGSHNSRRLVRYDSGNGALNVNAKDDFDSRHVGVSGQAGWLFETGSIDIEPLVGFDYTWVSQNAVREKDAGIFGLTIDDREDDIFSAVAGLRLSTVYHHTRYLHTSLLWMDGVWRPSIDLRWRQAFSGYDRDVTARIASAPESVSSFTIESQEDKGGFEVSAALAFEPEAANRLQFQFRYDAYRASHTLQHDLVARVRLGF